MPSSPAPPPDAAALASHLPAELDELARYARRLVAAGSAPIEPEDLIQGTMARALLYAHSYQPGRPVQPWLRRMALHLYLDARTAWRRTPDSLTEEPAAAPGPDPHAAENVARLLAALPELERRVLCLFHGEGRSVAELARELALPESTVKSHLHRARRRLTEAEQRRKQGRREH